MILKKVELTIFQKAFVLISSISVWLFAFLIFKPWIVKFYSPYFHEFADGPKLFLKHTFIYSTPTALICYLWIRFLQYYKLIPQIYFKISKSNVTQGIKYGIAIVILTFVLSPLLGLTFTFHFNPYSIAGNFFSNFCEEIIFRGLLFFAIYSATNNKFIGIIISGIIFGLTHEQYPWLVKGYIMLIGALLSYLTSDKNNLVPAVVAHDISDWILDLFL